MAENEAQGAPTKHYPSPDLVDKVLENVAPQELTIKDGNTQATVLFVPNGMSVESAKKYINEFRKNPERRVGVHIASRLPSFVDLTKRFIEDNPEKGEAVIFGECEVSGNSIKANLTTILDFHPANPNNEDARNRGHKISYNFPISVQFKPWLEKNAKGMSQEDFALFLEEHLPEIVIATDEEKASINGLKPNFGEPLRILELSRDLVIYSSEEVVQTFKPSSGEREIKFSVTHKTGEAKNATGTVANIPDFFVVRSPIFAGGADERILVRLRYRKVDGAVVWFYELYRLDKILNLAFDEAVKVVREQTKLPLYVGTAA